MAARSRIVTALLWMLTLMLAVLVAGTLMASRSWPGDMVTFFQPQLALGALLILGLAILLRCWLPSLVLALLFAVAAYPLFITDAPLAASAATSNLRIVSANVLFDNPQPERFADVVVALSPDIIVTQEARYDWPEVLRALPGYPYLVGPQLYRWNSNLVVSRYPMRARMVPDMPPSGLALGGGLAMRVEVDVPGRDRPLVIYAAHAPTPRTLAGWEARNLYLDTLAERIAAEPEGTQVILAADWNTPVWSPAYPRTLFLSGLEATERSAWPAATRLFATIFGINIGTPIDNIAVSRGIGVKDHFLGPNYGSDHLPVVADLELP
ncbi:MAG: endonuclease/exonuclease/phosphatase family protein [Mesorhizobium sp.]|nr:endonuclease/exonuclease/phosphatase family protein [Mesorhizobium sp.]MBL8580527.1 endonuclease/exonuclease/phosphatase family protein [Mesorhizobium sp.]